MPPEVLEMVLSAAKAVKLMANIARAHDGSVRLRLTARTAESTGLLVHQRIPMTPIDFYAMQIDI